MVQSHAHAVHILVVTMLQLFLLALASWTNCKLVVCQFSVLRKLRRGFCTIVLHVTGTLIVSQNYQQLTIIISSAHILICFCNYKKKKR